MSYHPSLDVQEITNERGYKDYTYAAPFALKDAAAAAYEQARAQGVRVFRKFDPATKRWTGNAAWLDILSALVAEQPAAASRPARPMFKGSVPAPAPAPAAPADSRSAALAAQAALGALDACLVAEGDAPRRMALRILRERFAEVFLAQPAAA